MGLRNFPILVQSVVVDVMLCWHAQIMNFSPRCSLMRQVKRFPVENLCNEAGMRRMSGVRAYGWERGITESRPFQR